MSEVLYTFEEGVEMPGPTFDNSDVLIAETVGATPVESSAFTIGAGANALIVTVSTIDNANPPTSVDWKVGETTQAMTLVEFVGSAAGATVAISAWRLDNPTVGEGNVVMENPISSATVVIATSVADAGPTRDTGENTTDAVASGISVSADALEDDLVITGVAKRNDSELIVSIDADTTLDNGRTTSIGATGICQIAGAETASADGTITHTAAFSPNRPGAAVMLVIGPAPEPPEPGEGGGLRGRVYGSLRGRVFGVR